MARGDGRRATGDRRPATGDRRRATGDRRPATDVEISESRERSLHSQRGVGATPHERTTDD